MAPDTTPAPSAAPEPGPGYHSHSYYATEDGGEYAVTHSADGRTSVIVERGFKTPRAVCDRVNELNGRQP